ncbi:MAG: hypothetical protein J0I06_07940 [Planctomycetes bacterium]|nr:hypothetical protein [Planctomycetota bacterium]
MTAPVRFGYMTNSLENLRLARDIAAAEGFVVDMLPPDAPAPEPGTFDGIMADLAPAGRHALERKTFLNKLARVARAFPVVVYDRAAGYPETSAMRAAGIKWFPTIRPRAFAALLDHPLAAKVAAAKAARDEAAEELTTVSE